MLSKRLQCIVEAVGRAECVLDVGTDHGYVPIRLIENGQAQRAIASDISGASLQKAKEQIIRRGITDIETRLGSGLDIIAPGECDAIVMAGMGGLLMADILLKSKMKLGRYCHLVLQPMNNVQAVRLAIEAIGAHPVLEKIVFEDGCYYQIIATEPGKMQISTPIDYWIGLTGIREENETFEKFVYHLIQKENHILTQVSAVDTDSARRRRHQSQGMLDMLKEVAAHG